MFWDYDGRTDIDRVDAPTLVIHGPADGIVPIDVAYGTVKRLPQSAFCRIERTGHVAFIERPAVYNDLLRALIDVSVENYPFGEAVQNRLGDRTF